LYAVVIIITLIACHRAVQKHDKTLDLPSLKVPSEPDPFEIAFLRGGANEVARIIVFSLMQRGYLYAINEENEIGKAATPPDPRHLTPIERCVFDWYTKPHKPQDIFNSSDSPATRVLEYCAPYERRLINEQLLVPDEIKSAGWQIWATGTLVLAGLGGYKL